MHGCGEMHLSCYMLGRYGYLLLPARGDGPARKICHGLPAATVCCLTAGPYTSVPGFMVGISQIG